MVVTEENVDAFAEHFVALPPPLEIQQKMGRLVGHCEQRRKGARTPLIYLCKTATITSTDFAHWVRWWIPTRVQATL